MRRLLKPSTALAFDARPRKSAPIPLSACRRADGLELALLRGLSGRFVALGVETEISNLTAAIAAGGNMVPVLDALKAREEERGRLQQQLDTPQRWRNGEPT